MRLNYSRRREFITSLAGAAAWPFATRAQQPERMRRIDVLMAYAESDREGQALVAAFREGLQKLGWTESCNIRIDTRWAGRRGVDATVREGNRRATARPHSFRPLRWLQTNSSGWCS
jgi:hypothetical protein